MFRLIFVGVSIFLNSSLIWADSDSALLASGKCLSIVRSNDGETETQKADSVNSKSREPFLFAGSALVKGVGNLQGIYEIDLEGNLRFYGLKAASSNAVLIGRETQYYRVFKSPRGFIQLNFSSAGKLLNHEVLSDTQANEIAAVDKRYKSGIPDANEYNDPRTGSQNDPFRVALCSALGRNVSRYMKSAQEYYGALTFETKETPTSASFDLGVRKNAVRKCNELVYSKKNCRYHGMVQECLDHYQRILKTSYQNEINALVANHSTCLSAVQTFCRKEFPALSRTNEMARKSPDFDLSGAQVSCSGKGETYTVKVVVGSGNKAISRNASEAATAAQRVQ